MKKTVFLSMAFLMSMAQFLSAQNCQKLNQSVLNNTPTIYFVDNNTPSLGYISGHNAYGDRAQANFYTNPYVQGNIDSVWLYFGVAKASNINKFITVNIWDNTGPGNKPNNIIASQNVSISNISTTGATAVRFDPPVTVTTNFYVGFSYTYANGDTVAIYTSEDGQPVSAPAWYEEALTIPASWFPYTTNWSYNISHFIVAKLCEQQAGCPTILANATANDNTSCNQSNGKITITATNGAAPYQYNIGSGNQSSNEFENLAAGNYIITVTDDNGCTSTSSLTTVGDDFLLPNIVVDNIVSNTSCLNPNGSVDLTLSGGVSPYSFVLELPNGDTETGNGLVPNTYPIVGLITGAYNLEITGDNGCTATTSFNVTNNLPTIVLAEVNNINNTSCTNPNGTFTVEASGGQGDYTYSDGNITNINGVFSGLDAGNYDVTVTDDASGCTATTSVTIINQTNAPLVTFSNNVANTSCATPFNGSVQVTISGATVSFEVVAEGPGGFSYNVPTVPAGSLPLNALEPGDYSVTVTDGNGCFTIEEVTIADNSAVLSISETNNTDNTSCATANGAFTVEANGGTPAYTYEVAGIGTSTTGVFENLSAGSYDVTATDDEGCALTTSVTILGATVNPSVNIDAVTGNTSCTAPFNGDVEYTVTSSLGNFSYSLEGSNGFTDNNSGLTDGSYIVANLEDDNYSITVTDDDNGCTAVETFTIDNDAVALTVTELTSTENTLCVGGNGIFTVEASGGTPNYEYAIASNTNVDGIFENLAGGTYTVTATDDNGCTGTTNVVINDNTVNPSLSVGSVANNTACTAPFNGAFTVNASSATAPYTYDAGTASNATGAFTALEAGSYNVTVTDDNGCTATIDVDVLNNLPVLDLTMSSQAASSQTATDGEATVNVTGGTPGYSYSWDDNNAGTTATVTGLLTGTYNVTVTDDNGCTATESIFVDFVVGIASAVNINTEVYPNPTNNNININVSVPKASNVDVELYNALGALITKETHFDVVQFSTIFELINYDNGVYFLKVKAENEVSSYRVLLNK